MQSLEARAGSATFSTPALENTYRVVEEIPIPTQEFLLFTPDMTHATITSMGSGDLAAKDHGQVVAIVNHALDLQTKDSIDKTGSMIPPYAKEKGKELRKQLDAFKHATAVAELTPEATQIVERYTHADANATSMEDQIIKRLATAKQRFYESDTDGTLTLEPDKYLEQLLPASSTGEAILKQHGRESFPEAFAATWNHGISRLPDTYTEAGQQVDLRPGVNDAIEYFNQRGDEFGILSANFTVFVDGVRKQIPAAEQVKIKAVTENDLSATEKGDVLIQDAIANPDKTVVYIGDGSSDLPSIKAAKYVALYWALEGSSFAKELEETNTPHYTYKTFNDIKEKMQYLDAKAAEMIQTPQRELQTVA